MSNSFLSWLDNWYNKLSKTTIQKLQKDPSRIAVVCVDMVAGFCSKGALASPDIASIIPQVVSLLKKSHKFGVKNFILVQDAHSDKAEEFNAYPPHCQKGSDEAETIPEINKLPFSKLFKKIEKNSLHPSYGTKFGSFISKHSEIDTFIVVGDCTDLCIYSAAMHLRLSANSQNLKRNIIIPENCVATYDMSVAQAKKVGALPHDREILHKIFLYHMALNAVTIVANIH